MEVIMMSGLTARRSEYLSRVAVNDHHIWLECRILKGSGHHAVVLSKIQSAHVSSEL